VLPKAFQIAEEDSGSELAQRARYATAWIYENKLEDVQGAISAYTVLAEEYPNSDAGKIAQNKIKIPPVEVDSLGTPTDSTYIENADSLIIDGTDETVPSLEEQMEIPLEDQNGEESENPDDGNN
jgi:hypothetical protein